VNGNNEDLDRILSPLGLRWRITLFKRFCKELVDKYNGRIPVNRKDLLSLPGIGDYAASAFSSFHLNEPYPLIDANTVRFASRYFGITRGPESRRNKLFKVIMGELLPNRYSGRFNYCLLDFAMNICSTKPDCKNCKLQFKCRYFKDNSNEY